MGDLVLRKAEVSDSTRSRGKLAPNWEGSYRVIKVVRDETYTLATMEGRVLPRTLTHIKPTKILRIMWRDASRVVLMKMRLQKMSGIK
ncbi:hypothetical protein B296_00010518 [Ensete ventricosum]|uniref:Reverse transcriptase domain-containing protein n=1 Tax=Ensete ventricosum TaxID=4639 RepID=A0A426Z9F1_ENSVE|nr:hypothetical protein B296_00010518 [Ensete ventricosum]